MTLRTLGRGFWLGILASLLLHGVLLSNGGFRLPVWQDAPVLEARLESAEFKSVPLPTTEILAEPAAVKPTPVAETTAPTAPEPVVPPTSPGAPPPASTPLVAVKPNTIEAPPPPPPIAPPADAQATLTESARNLKSLPAQLEIEFELNGMVSGRQSHRWQRSGARYTLETEGEVTGLASLFVRGKLTQTSQGKIGALGLMPESYETRHLTGKQENLKFDYDNNQIESTRIDNKHGKRTQVLPLLTGAQDPLSAIYQLAMVAQDDKDGLIVAAGAKRVKGYAYRVLGSEKLETSLGAVTALHVTRTGEGGNRDMHLWLSSTHHYLPIKISYVDDDGKEWVLQATRIRAE